MTIRTVGVLGCGLMGSGIAQVSAAAGYKTVVREVDDSFAAEGARADRKFLDDGVAKGKVTAEARDTTLGNLTGTTTLRRARRLRPRHRGDRREPRREARRPTRRSSTSSKPHTIFVSNTSSLCITELRGHDEAAGPVRRPALLQSGAADEARRGRPRADDERRDVPDASSRSRSRSARSRSPRPTARASSSTGCSCRTCSTRSAPTRTASARSRTSTRG